MKPSRLARRLQRHLRAKNGWTTLPVCPACGIQRRPSDFTADGLCGICELERARDYEEAMRPDGTPACPPPRDEILDDGFDFEVGHG